MGRLAAIAGRPPPERGLARWSPWPHWRPCSRGSTSAAASGPTREGWWILFPVAGVVLGSAWLASYADRHDLGTLGGEAVRYLGLACLAAGGTLRVGPMFLLGPRFTWPLASQSGHPLLTTGLYRLIRHPSYAGGLLGMAGWSLVFRSGIGLVLTLLVVPAVVAVIREEEGLLLVEHGEAYADYRRNTWRLVPFFY